jgi:endonuclease/exonuclease/phosphatase (EEP) superfamily protein YafD
MAATLISGLVLSFVVTTCLGLVVSVMYWTWLLSEAHSIALLVCVASGVWIFFIWVTEIIIKMRRYRLWKLGQSAPVPEPGFTKLAYASIKDKYCIKVTIKE